MKKFLVVTDKENYNTVRIPYPDNFVNNWNLDVKTEEVYTVEDIPQSNFRNPSFSRNELLVVLAYHIRNNSFGAGKIEAIKKLRQWSDWGLKESKDFVVWFHESGEYLKYV